ncbi:DUF2188 domain-containing protein [Mesoplasma syrphidae]|uniref:DUF2188 domain-containing protein n=1 Tax=Mesoplasma syrphidae TaxID=225999 RepID=A0A2K9C8P9_9MOLU|nr:DUF2188 domain-containing protein [Mesoplasma syrphidae]AUF83395.1 DUF2188 domain-containing protein [Mesoplasma syrphidae]
MEKNRWSVERDKKGFIHVRLNQKTGNFKTKAEAIDMARKMAKGNRTILRIHTDKSGYDIVDYTSIQTSNEIFDKTLSDVKLARAELTVAKVEKQKRKSELKVAHETEHYIAKRKYDLAKERLKKSKMNLKNALKNNKRALKTINN